MPGAGSLKATQYVYGLAAKDGLTLATVSRGMATDPLLNDAKFDATRLTWIGSVTSETSICATWQTSPVKTWDDMFNREFTLGGSATGADPDTFALIMRNLFGAKVRLVTGYPGGNDINLAMERGEVSGRCGWSWSSVLSTRMNWFKEKKINVLMQLALEKHDDLPNVPLVVDLAKDPEQRQILRIIFARQALGRPFLGPPGVPQDRAAALQKAFMDTVQDKALLAEADKAELEMTPLSGPAIQKIIDEAAKTDPAVLKKAAAMLQVEQPKAKKE
jgi:tripartite-type tricarboxylate transporter receptor subunit TctC